MIGYQYFQNMCNKNMVILCCKMTYNYTGLAKNKILVISLPNYGNDYIPTFVIFIVVTIDE